MNELEYLISCLDGTYRFYAKYDDVVNYAIETDIAGLENLNGDLDDASGKAFKEAVEAAHMESWDQEYPCEGSVIEDGIRWSAVLLKDGKEYRSHGEESYVPYGHEELVRAIRICDPNNDYLF
ncbi:MAG: hypothetical protein IKS69_00885 [Erysipelotrichaceae bacterium]|nr:hypothetical protein [Erysipelotrichaceae bacterium]